MTALMKILSNLIAGRGVAAPKLTGGMRMQFHAADDHDPANRLLCYRAGVAPSMTELATVRQHLEKLLPVGTDIVLGAKDLVYEGSDGLERRGRVFSWQVRQVQQMSILDGAESSASETPGAYE